MGGRPVVVRVLKVGSSKLPATKTLASVPFVAWDDREWGLQDGGPGPASFLLASW